MGWGAPCWEGPITCQPPQASLQSQELGHCSAHGRPRPQGLMGWGPGPHSDGPLPLQPPQGSLHGAARDLLQMGQLAARERPQVSRAGGGPRAGLGVAVPAPTPCAALSLDALSTGPRPPACSAGWSPTPRVQAAHTRVLSLPSPVPEPGHPPRASDRSLPSFAALGPTAGSACSSTPAGAPPLSEGTAWGRAGL